MVAFAPHLPPLTSQPSAAQKISGTDRPPESGTRSDQRKSLSERGPAAMVSIDESNVRIAQAAHLYQTQASADLARGVGGAALSVVREMAELADRAGAGDLPEAERARLDRAFRDARAGLDGDAATAEFGGVNLLAGKRIVRTVTNMSGLSFEIRGFPLDSASLGLADAELGSADSARAAAQASRRAGTIVGESVALFESEAGVARLQRESMREMAITLDRDLSAAIDPGVEEADARTLAGIAAGLIESGGRAIFSHTADAMDILDDAAAE
jgi:flagellin-like hook-associated protein FlgL